MCVYSPRVRSRYCSLHSVLNAAQILLLVAVVPKKEFLILYLHLGTQDLEGWSMTVFQPVCLSWQTQHEQQRRERPEVDIHITQQKTVQVLENMRLKMEMRKQDKTFCCSSPS